MQSLLFLVYLYSSRNILVLVHHQAAVSHHMSVLFCETVHKSVTLTPKLLKTVILLWTRSLFQHSG